MPAPDTDHHDAQELPASNATDTSSTANGDAPEDPKEPVKEETTTAAAAPPTSAQKTTPGTICGVCNTQESKYTCVRCSLPFCSVACSTIHRANHPAAGEEATATPAIVDAAPKNGIPAKPIPGTVSAAGAPNPFSVLEKSQELQTLFMMYPRLRSQLRDIYSATLPPTDDSGHAAGNYGGNDQSYRGGGGGRGGNRANGQNRGPWSSDRGTQDGIDALKEQSEQYGKGGEGIREYSELVLKLVSLEGVDVAKLVQDEVAEENAKIIAQLLNGDSY